MIWRSFQENRTSCSLINRFALPIEGIYSFTMISVLRTFFSQLILIVLLGILFPVACATDTDTSAPTPVPLIVKAPVSSGYDQKFSRPPRAPYYDTDRNIVVTESILPTIKHLVEGNNTRFCITEWQPDNNAGLLTITSRTIFEGTTKITNEETLVARKVAPHVYVYPDCDGKQRVFIVNVDHRGTMLGLTCLFYAKGEQLTGRTVIYQRK